jgi:hypothetical protein
MHHAKVTKRFVKKKSKSTVPSKTNNAQNRKTFQTRGLVPNKNKI